MKHATEIIPTKISYVGERFTLEIPNSRPELPLLKVTYVTTATYECQCGTWTRQSMLKTFSKDHKPLCPTCMRPMKWGKRTLRPLVRNWQERLEEACESYAS